MFVVSAEEDRSDLKLLSPLDERSVLQRYKMGDSAAFGELVLLYRRNVYGYLVRCGVPERHQEACFREIFLQVHQASGDYPPESALKPWLFAIVIRVVRAQLRSDRVTALLRAGDLPSPGATSNSSSASQTASWLQQSLRALPLAQREATALCALEKMSLQDAAFALNIQVSALRAQLRKGKLRLAQMHLNAQEVQR